MSSTEVHSDERRGHVTVTRGTETVLTFAETGNQLQVWQHGSGVELSPEDARALASALYAWAARRLKMKVRSA